MLSLFKLPFVMLIFLLKIKRSRHRHLIVCHELYWTMVKLWVKGEMSKDSEQEVDVRLLGLTISGYGAKVLLWLIDDIFVKEIYYTTLDEKTPFIIDCGANIGLSLLYFKYKYPESEVWAFEPSPIAFPVLQKNVAQNRLKGVVLHNVALSDTEGSIDFFIGDVKGSLISSVRADRSASRKIEVPARLLSIYIAEKRCHLMKIDVEGAEWQILNNLDQNQKMGRIDRFAMEFHLKNEKYPARMGEFLSLLERNHFDYNLMADFAGDGHYQDLFIYARRMPINGR